LACAGLPKAHDTIGIALSVSNPNMGIIWELNTDHIDSDIVKKKSSQYYRQDISNNMTGGGMFYYWLFDAEDYGTTTIRFESRNNWGEGNLESSFEVEVIVE
jgi:predicted secreted protein